MEGRAEGERPWREVEGFQGEEDWGSRRIKSFPLDPDTRQRQITRDLGVLGGSASSHTQRSFPLQAAAMSPRVVVKKMPKLCVPPAQRDQDIMHGRMLLVCHAAFGNQFVHYRLINKLEAPTNERLILYMLFAHSHWYSSCKKALFFKNIYVYFMS